MIVYDSRIAGDTHVPITTSNTSCRDDAQTFELPASFQVNNSECRNSVIGAYESSSSTGNFSAALDERPSLLPSNLDSVYTKGIAKVMAEMTAGTERILDAIRAMHNDVLKAVEDQRSSNRAVMGKFAETQMLIQLKGIHKLASPHVQMAQGKFSAEVEDLDPRLKIPVKTRRALVEIDGLLMDANLRKNMILWIEKNWKPPSGRKAMALFMRNFFHQRMMTQIYCCNSKPNGLQGRDPQLRTITSIEERDSQIYTPEQDDPEIQDYDAVPLNLQHRLQQEHLRIPLNKLPGFYAAVEQYAALHLTAAEMDKIRSHMNKTIRECRNAERTARIGKQMRDDEDDNTKPDFEVAKSSKLTKCIFIHSNGEHSELESQLTQVYLKLGDDKDRNF